MTFYTIMPTELIFPHQHQELTNYFEMIYNGIPVMVEHDGGKNFRIDRILSTDPVHYLNNQVQPGTVIPIISILSH